MTKPQLKKDIHVETFANSLKIYPATNKAKVWMENNCGEFGALKRDTFEQGWWILELNPCFNAKEVMTYIANMGAQ